MINRSYEVVERQVREIMAGDLPDPHESTLGSRIEAVAQMDAQWSARYRGALPRAADLAVLVGVTKRTIERYRAMIRLYTLG